ncbi:hypothetical protein QVN91_12440 [Bacteroides caecigallinarum]|uniref:hypothetical protein n=1 Tax=Bacteroides caecigallinarum TaxID=1411144 RepID=UPI001F1B61CD|nr:hypothetical protein [Bacteroides caecigallinarum]MCF2737390.1 hypothetical protein [Bacteroides caecigallinarum]MDN0053745.1 hypothetical protein [Bacteroides caecigallinarum]MDN0072490.1 hypothetical protein [Bacteroides caecigallinarum]
MLKKEDSIVDEKQVYLKPECKIYELELESAVLNTSTSQNKDVIGGDAEINSFLYGRTYDTSVF